MYSIFCRSQRLQWAGIVECQMREHLKMLTNWVPQWKRLRDRLRKKWIVYVEGTGVGQKRRRTGSEWTGVRDRSQWRSFVEEAKSHSGMKHRDDDEYSNDKPTLTIFFIFPSEAIHLPIAPAVLIHAHVTSLARKMPCSTLNPFVTMWPVASQ